MSYQIFVSAQVEQSVIISNKYGIYEFTVYRILGS